MNEQFMVYLWSISSGIKMFLYLTGAITGLISFIVIICFLGCSYDEKKLKTKHWFLLLIPIILFFNIFISILIPSKQDLALIWAYPAIKSGITNKKVIQIPEKILDLTNKYLDEQIKNINKKV